MVDQDLGDIEYNAYIHNMREEQFPMLKGSLYLDHAGTTLTSKLVMDKFHAEMMSHLYGNPHSFSQASQQTSHTIDNVRLRLLRLFNANPDHFDVVFTANATAAIKLVGDIFRDAPGGFEYGYHVEAHTSLVGLRELAASQRCFVDDKEVVQWLAGGTSMTESSGGSSIQLFAYPGQSNLNGRKLPLEWSSQARSTMSNTRTYALLDAAALVATSSFDLGNPESAPDFTALSLYKIFGFPDLGALIVRKRSAHVFDHRRYFGGGTVDMVLTSLSANPDEGPHHFTKTSSLHDRLEDGTLPYHSIAALGVAMAAHQQLFQSLDRVARHTSFLARKLYEGVSGLRHDNGKPAASIHVSKASELYLNHRFQGPVVSFNLLSPSGLWISNAEFEKLAFARSVNVRTGSLCNPGGTALHLELTSEEIRNNFDAGYRCGSDADVLNDKPTGMIRASLGAMSTMADVEKFLGFLTEYFVERRTQVCEEDFCLTPTATLASSLHIESLTVYPIKSCAGWQLPSNRSWTIRAEGLDWDREWCIVHATTAKTLSQKRYPRMALIKPELDLDARVLRVRGTHAETLKVLHVDIPLDARPDLSATDSLHTEMGAEVCGVQRNLAFYDSAALDGFFSDCIGIPCRLARFPASGRSYSTRHSKPHLVSRGVAGSDQPITLSNESPILTITRASLNRLNETIKARKGKAASPAVFRANIVLADTDQSTPGAERPYAEDQWSGMKIGNGMFEFLGGCRRCQMICIDQSTGEKNEEPLTTLAKTRRINGRIMFGVHTALVPPEDGIHNVTVRVGDAVCII
ncbi:hypothetical protein ANO11243_029110 [Dothideomycetidae sp. 11243]|nr:hypothetical protein ANO11243_029110 [fungal sp. No.11243]